MAKNGFGKAGRHELATALKWQKSQKSASAKKTKKSVFIADYHFRDFGLICVLAERYACGRTTFAPSLVQRFVRANISLIENKEIGAMIADIQRQSLFMNGLGDPDLDAPGWLRLLDDLRDELNRREEL